MTLRNLKPFIVRFFLVHWIRLSPLDKSPIRPVMIIVNARIVNRRFLFIRILLLRLRRSALIVILLLQSSHQKLMVPLTILSILSRQKVIRICPLNCSWALLVHGSLRSLLDVNLDRRRIVILMNDITLRKRLK